ncbi:protein YIPF1 homolog isoform X5 [Solanum tuberosum]|uniref:protein YIPF1 homolog isoform X5 n=1 Tax=Solanum tuberosum TaxID=4113 RepID=UPI00073A2134|nr:PREDICTED: protein YIPF1 homolog isoform X5 [Solanum tuberosum]
MDDSYTNFPTSHLVGSVPAVVTEEKNSYKPQEGDGEQSTNKWNGVFSVSSYTEYFNVDTDLVLNRLMSSLNPTTGDFFSKIDANPDLYGLIWISTTLVFVLSSIGNCATYLMQSDSNSSWNFDVNYVNVAACSVYGYALLVPLGFYFLIRYMGISASLIRFWCLWGYSLFVLVLSSFLLIIPVEFLRWTITIAAATTSASFVALNLRTYVQSDDLMIILVASFALQAALTIFIKMWFFS